MDDSGLARSRLWFWVTAGGTAGLDLASKHLAFSSDAVASPGGMAVMEPMLRFVCHLNRGMVWGLGSGHPLLIVGIVALVAPCLVVMAYSCRMATAPLWALGLVLGGAAGNVCDRLVFAGVRDFIQVDLGFWPADPWPVFNLADAAIVAGFLVYTAWSFRAPATQPERGATDPPGEASAPVGEDAE